MPSSCLRDSTISYDEFCEDEPPESVASLGEIAPCETCNTFSSPDGAEIWLNWSIWSCDEALYSGIRPGDVTSLIGPPKLRIGSFVMPGVRAMRVKRQLTCLHTCEKPGTCANSTRPSTHETNGRSPRSRHSVSPAAYWDATPEQIDRHPGDELVYYPKCGARIEVVRFSRPDVVTVS